ncbi:hypothetical protein KM043_018371 [Ampulex compressa]|nr:hypothetical protein KM043_018371 [Ampulex compressa]
MINESLRTQQDSFTGVPDFQIAAVLLILALCQAENPGSGEAEVNDPQEPKTESDEDEGSLEEQDENELPILPPIILLDFGNDTTDDNSTSEEKSKRTVNNRLGYGFERNTLQSGRYNYYFPGGKTGTTVSIEESISPFLPKTIIEKVEPINRQNEGSKSYEQYRHQENTFDSSRSKVHSNFRNLNFQPASRGQHVFGLRTKLHKASSLNLESYQNVVSTPRPTARPYGYSNSGYRNNVALSTTSSPLSYAPTEPTDYVTQNPSAYVAQGNSFDYTAHSSFYRRPAISQSYRGQNVQANQDPHGYGAQSEIVPTSTQSPTNFDPQYASVPPQFANLPKYTVENGVRYENKIFWKYPDGRVSDMPPATYVETSSGYSQALESQTGKPSNSYPVYETGTGENGIYSQGPVQFPSVQEQGAQEQSPFISAESLSSNLPQQQVYRLGYQSLIGQKHSAALAQQAKANSEAAPSRALSSSASRQPTASRSRTQKYQSSTYRHQISVPKYMVNGPNPEYTGVRTTESTLKSSTPSSNLFTASGELQPHVLSRYTPRVQHYLRKVFVAGGSSSRKESTTGKDLRGYSNLQYSDLLNYHPSISQYIRNPSSILNVHPTFVQAGNSLIPVIILRVDGAPPIQPKPAPNVNLKALLQQYLIQYANSIQDLTQPSNYDLGTEQSARVQNSVSGRSPLLDLIRLTQNDARDSASYTSDSYSGRSSYETSDLNKAFSRNKYGERTVGRQKVKSVQIVDDPRFAMYKVKD